MEGSRRRNYTSKWRRSLCLASAIRGTRTRLGDRIPLSAGGSFFLVHKRRVQLAHGCGSASHQRSSLVTNALKMACHISKEVWDKLRLGRAVGATFAELARQSGINRNTLLSYAARDGWSQQIATARQQADNGKPDVTDVVQKVLAGRHRETKLALSDFLLKCISEASKRGIVAEDLDDVEKLERIARRSSPNQSRSTTVRSGCTST